MAIIHLLDDDVAVTRACAFYWKVWDTRSGAGSTEKPSPAEVNLHQVGVVLLDMRMPGLDGQGVHDEMLRRGSTLAVVFLTGHGDVPMAVAQMKRGAVDFLQKPVSAGPLQAALEHALQVSITACTRHEIVACYQQLTPKERQLAGLVAQGLMNREIADAMNIAVRTVEVHRARVMEKCRRGARLSWFTDSSRFCRFMTVI